MRNRIVFFVTIALLLTSFSDVYPKGPVKHQVLQPKSKNRGPVFLGPAGVLTNWTMPNLCKAYNFPTGLTGGAVIGIGEFGGGYLKSDLDLFSQTFMNGTPINISDVSINGGVNNPGVDLGADAEVTLDIEIAAAAYYYCTGKAPTIKMFFAPNNSSFINNNALVFAAAASNGCDVLSISWGEDENFVSTTDLQNLESAAISATSKGLAIFVASGDGDATDERGGQSDGKNHINAIASPPHVIAVGGTTKTTSSEVTWNNLYSLGTSYPLGTGGGYSTVFPVQSWQTGAPIAPVGNNGTGRMIPDVSANADPLTPYEIALEGVIQAAGNGTSAATPLWAGLIASFGKKPGFISPTLWAVKNRSGFTDITQGNNILFNAAAGPDACTGLGVPVGTSLATILAPSTPPVITPANAKASFANNMLTITGNTSTDNNPHNLTVIQQTQQGGKSTLITIQGANGTKINGVPYVSYTVSGNWNLSVNFAGGDDAIAFVGVVVPNTNSPSIVLGAGNDKVAFTLTNITNLNVDGGAGNNTLLTTSSRLTNIRATNFTSIH